MIYVYIAAGLIGLYLVITLGLFFFVFYRPRPLDFTKMKSFPYKDVIKEGLELIKTKEYEKILIKSFDKINLVGYLFTIAEAKGTLILVHGYSSNGFQDFGSVFTTYQNLGYNLLIISQRAHNESQGHFCTYGIKESKDVQKWVEFVNIRFPNMPIRFSGISLGSSTVLFASNKSLPNVISIVADSGFTSPFEEIKHVGKQIIKIPTFFYTGILGLYARIFLHINYKESALDCVKETKIPILFIHGTGDDFVPFKMGEELYNACVSKKEALFIKDATHGNSYLQEMDTVLDGLYKFFSETERK